MTQSGGGVCVREGLREKATRRRDFLEAEAQEQMRSRVKCVGVGSVHRWETEAKGVVRPWRMPKGREQRGCILQTLAHRGTHIRDA